MSDEPTRQYEDAYLWAPADRVRLEELREDMTSALNRATELAKVPRRGDAPRLMSEDRPEPDAQDAASSEEIREAAAALDEFVSEAKTRARVVRVVALPRRRWRALKDAHPARMVKTTTKDAEGKDVESEKPHEVDEGHGFNVETIADDLVPECVADAFSSKPAVDAFLDDLSEPDFDSLYAASLRVNAGGFAPPKAEFSLHADRIIGAISNLRDHSA